MDATTSSLSFSIVEDTGELHARFDPAGGASAPDTPALREQLTAAGWGNLFLDERAIERFIQACPGAGEVVDLPIGCRRDGSFTLTLDDDLMAAYLTLTPPQGGKPVGNAVLEALREQGVVHGLRQAELNAALAVGQCERLLIAQGERPQEGVPARFESLFIKLAEAQKAADENAVIHLADISHLLLVHPGNPLMRRHPAVPGKAGTDIKGQAVQPKDIEDESFAANLQGAAPDAQDPDLLVATLAGQPVALPNGVMVNPVIDVANVDLTTGNIDFEGTVKVTGDIKFGMRVKVTGDVIVSGTVEAAEIIAGGNVAVHGGIIGHADTHSGAAHGLPENTARIRCDGTLAALFAENAHIEAGDSIHLERGASHCEMTARKEIVIGKPGSKSGHLVGGTAQATDLIQCAVLGSPAGGTTRVQVGFDPYLDGVIHDKKHLLEHKTEELERVLLLQRYLKQNPQKDKDGVGDKTENTRVQLLADIAALNAELEQLSEQHQATDHARVEVSKAVHFGAEIRVGRQVLAVKDDRTGLVVRLQDGELVVD